jgi:hypothetical protein
MHEPHGSGAVAGRGAVEIDSLDERAGTIAYSNNGDSDFSHGKKKSYPELWASGKILSSRFNDIKVKVGNEM